MTVILVDKIPQNCGECPLCYEDNYFSINPPNQCNFAYAPMGLDITKKHEDCPLKSVDGLVERINKLAYSETEYGIEEFDASKIVRLDDLIEVIKEYCGMEDVE